MRKKVITEYKERFLGALKAQYNAYAMGESEEPYVKNAQLVEAQLEHEIYKRLWERREAFGRSGQIVYAVPIEALAEELGQKL